MSKENSPASYFVCGGVGGVLSAAFGYPMDTIKVRLQTMPAPKPGEPPLYTGMIDCVSKTIKMDGFSGLYRGIMAPVIVAAPVSAIYFFGFALGKKLMEKDINHVHTASELCAAGAFSGILASFFVAPSDHVKCLFQIPADFNPKHKCKGALDCFQKLYAHGGIRYVYKGFLATVMRDVPGFGLYFMAYESLMELIVPENSSGSSKMMATIFAGGLAGMCYWVVSMPLDVLKTRLQSAPDSKYKGMSDAFKYLIATEGPKGLFSGLTPVLIRAFPVNAVTFIGFEISLSIYNWVFTQL